MATMVSNNQTNPTFNLTSGYKPTIITTGPLPASWRGNVDEYCIKNVSFCNFLFDDNFLALVGYCMVSIASILGIFLLHCLFNKKKKKKKKERRFGYNIHETIRFITKFLFLLGLYFICIRIINSNTILLVTFVVSTIIVLPIMLFAIFRYWYQYRKVDMEEYYNRPNNKAILVKANN
jgi:uncharacterized Tic20 family protein